MAIRGQLYFTIWIDAPCHGDCPLHQKIHSIPCHLTRAPFPRQPWQMHHWRKCKRPPAHLCSSSPAPAAQNLGGESENNKKKYNISWSCKDTATKKKKKRDDIVVSTLEQPGVKAPGTAKRTPFFPLKSWSMDTLFPGSPSWTSTAGSCSPTCPGLRTQQCIKVEPHSLVTLTNIKKDMSMVV